MEEIKISVIVPIYNGQNTVIRCVNSILNQKLKEIEIILINDGSVDKTLELLNEIKDNRVRIFTQKNKGQSFSRNFGLDIARGEYISFVDSDDYIDEKMLFEMYQEAKLYNLDIVQCGYINLFEKKIEKTYLRKYSTDFLKKATVEVMQGKEYFQYSPSVAPWDKIYKKVFLKDIKFKFQVGISAEDALLLTKTFFYANRVKFINKNYYTYVRESFDSVTKPTTLNKKIKLSKDKIFVAKELFEFSLLNNWRGNIQRIILPNLLLPLLKKEMLQKSYRNEILRELKKVNFKKIIFQSLDKKTFIKLIGLILYKIKYKEI